jgi:hypothetical protein
MPTKLFLASRRKAKGNKMNITTTSTERAQAMYGLNNIDEFIDSITDSFTYRGCGADMIVAGLMSDAQEQMAHGDTEGARHTLNRAKAVLFKIMDGNLTGSRSRI